MTPKHKHTHLAGEWRVQAHAQAPRGPPLALGPHHHPDHAVVLVAPAAAQPRNLPYQIQTRIEREGRERWGR